MEKLYKILKTKFINFNLSTLDKKLIYYWNKFN